MGADRSDRIVRDLFEAALQGVDPTRAVARAVADLPTARDGPPPVVVAIGKAAGAMTAGLIGALPGGIARGVVITKDRRTVPDLPAHVEVFEAGHPLPDERSIRATEAALSVLGRSRPDEPVVVLISGGGSALFEAPVDGVSLDDIADLTSRMLRAGATINELNAVRSRLSRVKQGGLLRYIRSPTPTTLILSDVIGNDLSVIASGPTVTSNASVSPPAILDRFGLTASVPPRVRQYMAAEHRPVPVDVDGASAVIVADNDTALEWMVGQGTVWGDSEVVWKGKTGEARDLAVAWVDLCGRSRLTVPVGGGEATVTVRGDGVGGRNTEFAVAAALELDRRGMDDWVVASLATDGDDGPTGAAGGIVSRRTVQAARAVGINVEAALEANDTLRVLDAAGATVRTGPTGTNVNDIYVGVRVR